MTRRIAEHERITPLRKVVRKSRKTGKIRIHVLRPTTSLKDKLSNLHLLLRVPSFTRWPLQVRFFCEDVYQAWQKWTEQLSGDIRPGIKVILDLKQSVGTLHGDEVPMSTEVEGNRKREALGRGGVDGIDVGYHGVKNYLEKGIFLLAGDDVRCAICRSKIRPQGGTVLVCPREVCKAASHMTCLATRFLGAESSPTSIMPISGTCPNCKAEIQWVEMIKEMSLRARGEKEVAQLMKKPRERKTKAINANKSTIPMENRLEDEDEDRVEDELLDLDVPDEQLPDNWLFQGDDDDMVSMTSAESGISDRIDGESPTNSKAVGRKLKAVIEDSEWDEAEVVD